MEEKTIITIALLSMLSCGQSSNDNKTYEPHFKESFFEVALDSTSSKSVTFSFDIEGEYHKSVVLSNASDLSSFHKYLSSNKYLKKPINPTLDLRSTNFEDEDLPF